MIKSDKFNIVIFIILIISIFLLIGFNIYRNKKLDVDRKIEYIMGYNINTLINKADNIFKTSLRLINDDNTFEYEMNLNNQVKYYSINNKNRYMKINNFSIVENIFDREALNDFMDFRNIIFHEDDYFILEKKHNDINYVGSILDIYEYNNNYLTFISTNYYCDKEEFIGLLEEEPNCDFIKSENKVKMVLENGTLKITEFDSFIQIFK